ncbi:ROK family transcriptional regulator [Bifidobacterium parmae]|uniref:NagC family transcriptional regulator n=1 Tax=Bifidobacterium parmae TaxID=361854 RepID=A0A2N5IZ67_9BIFI|nr:ROK family transcriptional regulator [Bifidobacterium parmae]PLS27247.1 NagC family transcriptional regulator [Bifidobacterium parmae]
MTPQTRTRPLPLIVHGGHPGKASPSDVRRMNRTLIFNLLFPSDARSRAELSRITGLSRVAVSDVVNGMIDEGLIRESGHATSVSGKGKRATLLAVDPTRLHVIGVDLSQDRLVEGAVTDLRGTPQNHMEIALEPDASMDPDDIIRLVDRLGSDIDGDSLIGIGIATPGVVSDGVIRESTALGWRDIDLAAAVGARFPVPVTVVNDTIASMITERFFGDAESNLMFVKIGRGIAAATLIDDVPVLGEHDAGGEIGHIALDPDQGPPCPCGKHGCMETLIGAPALRARMSGADANGRTAVLQDAGSYFASAIAMPIGLLDIDDVCVYGPADIVNGTFLDAAQNRLDAMTVSDFHERTRIRRCQQGAGIALRGAAVAATMRHLESA